MGQRCRRMVLCGMLLGGTLAPALAHDVVLVNGQTLEVERLERQGDAVVLELTGGGTLGLLAGHVASVDGAPLGVAPEEAPFVAPAPARRRPRPAPVPAEVPAAEAPSDLDRLIAGLADRYEVDPLLVEAVITVESMWDPDAVSPKGAMGLMQLMPATARGHGVTDPFDPKQNVEAGVRELSTQLKKHSGEIAVALAAYNAGGRAVERYRGIPPYRETMDYVERVLDLYFASQERQQGR